jgi:N-glycosylase/DNA lyase
VKAEREPLTIGKIRAVHRERGNEIRNRLAEFRAIGEHGSDEQFLEEMVFCFFTGGCSARMGLNSVNAVRPLLQSGDQSELAAALTGVHRYPNARSRYIVHSRDFLLEAFGLKIRTKLESFSDPLERRDWLVKEKGIKGLGYKEASHFLRNVGYRGYAILDKHVLRSLAELGFIDDPKPPNTKLKYLRVEDRFRDLTKQAGIDFDELDLVLWSIKTGVILK